MSSNAIVISGFGSLSALGENSEEVQASYTKNKTGISLHEVGGKEAYVAPLSASAESQIQNLLTEKREYRHLDRSVLLAILTARKAFDMSAMNDASHCGVSFGSSRGATNLFETYHRAYLEHPAGHTSARSSPTTTLGNVSSWVAQDLSLPEIALCHSSTCSSAFHSIANAVAWIRAGMASRFLAGGTEAALTGFTVAQMRALGIYSESAEEGYACRPYADPARNTFVLGEGAVCFALESAESFLSRSRDRTPLAYIEAIGVAMEPLTSPTSLSSDADCLAKSMRSALNSMSTPEPVDLIVLHAPGTIQGDEAELQAIQSIFGPSQPYLVSNKWLLGHTLGASGALSLEFALLLLHGMQIPELPYAHRLEQDKPSKISKIMINSAGFGGNAASLIISLPARSFYDKNIPSS